MSTPGQNTPNQYPIQTPRTRTRPRPEPAVGCSTPTTMATTTTVPILDCLWTKLPFLIHTAIEVPAAVSFLFSPTKQLPGATDEAKLILKSYGGLLLTSNYIAMYLYKRTVFDEVTRQIAVYLGMYHLWPAYRAISRIRQGYGSNGEQAVLGGPVVHLIVHIFCFICLFLAAYYGVERM